MKKRAFAVVAVILAVVLAFSFLPKKLMIETRDGKHHIFTIEIAATPQEQERGLMFREHMADDHGMLFTLGQPREVRFWMKNTLIPLDMLFIDASGDIKTIHANAVPGDLTSISSQVPVTGVLELTGGRAKALGIAVGDKVIYPYFKP